MLSLAAVEGPVTTSPQADGAAASAPSAEGGGSDVGDFVVNLFNGLPGFIERGVLVLVSILVVIALAILATAMWKRMMSASLTVRPFLDGAVEVKVGPGMASLVEERLVGALRRKGRGHAGYDLDQVAIDIELLADDNDLSKAVERLADLPQLRVVGALMALIERMLPSRGLSAAGELLPAGSNGVGVALALYEGGRLRARSSLWEHEVSLWFPGDGRDSSLSANGPPDESEKTRSEEPEAKANGLDEVDGDHAAHYGLAAPAAWWVQYEAARVFDKNVSLVTNSAQSFSLVGVGLAHERQAGFKEAEDAYASALVFDPYNVAALFNLAQLLARKRRSHAPAALLLVRAHEALGDRHRPPRQSPRDVAGQLRDPTWYRIQYALALQCLEISTNGDGSWGHEGGWPQGMSPDKSHEDGAWKEEFGSETQELLVRLARDQELVQWPSEKPAAEATRRAEELFIMAAEVLDDAGWHWVGRRPPRYVRWAKSASSWPGRLFRWLFKFHPKAPPVACDIELTRFLSRVVEPTAVILYCSTIVEDDGEYRRFRRAVLGRDGDDPQPVDRRDLRTGDARDWALRCLSALLADQRVDNSRQARLEARLYRTRYRAPVAPNPRASYGLACMLSRLATQAHKREDVGAKRSFLSSAAAQLERSLSDSPDDRRDGLAEWARVDPDLEGLRVHERPTFDTIVARWGPVERRQVERTQLGSSELVSAAYTGDSKILELQFEDGSRYQYFDVPDEVFRELLSAESADKFFEREVERKFAFVRV